MYVGDSIPFEPILEPNWVKKILDNVQIMRIFLPFSFPAESTKRKKLSFKMYQSEPPSKSLHLHMSFELTNLISRKICEAHDFFFYTLGK